MSLASARPARAGLSRAARHSSPPVRGTWLQAAALALASLLGSTHTASAAFNLGVQVPVHAGAQPYWIERGDLNGDGIPDLVTANYAANTVSVFMGLGFGAYSPKSDFATGAGPWSVAIADVNSDGKLDLLTADHTSQSVSVLAGDGSGGFGPADSYAVGTSPTGAVFVDFNNDGRPDIVAADYAVDKVSVWMNAGGTYGPRTDFATGPGPNWVEGGDVNGDGNPDIVVADYIENTVSVLLGNGAGGFGAKTGFVVGVGPTTLALGDVNQDGKLDIVTANDQGTVSVLLGNGAGGFGLNVDYATHGPAITVAIGDVDNDGNPDIVTANDDNTVSVLIGNGSGTFGAHADFTVGNAPDCVRIADLNGDGWPDLFTANINTNDVTLLLGNGTGTFRARADHANSRSPIEPLLYDKLFLFESDGADVLPRNGDGTFQAPTHYSAAAGPGQGTLQDLDQDGWADLVIYQNSLVKWYRSFNGADFVSGVGVANMGANALFAVQDIGRLGGPNGDQYPDIVGVNTFTGEVSTWINIRSNQTFQKVTTITGPGTPTAVAIGDFDGDGKADVVVGSNGTSAGVSVFPGDGGGFLWSPEAFSLPASADPTSIAVADLNGDGRPDLVTANTGIGTMSVLLGLGFDAFAAGVQYAMGSQPRSLVLEDVNRDGRLDAVVANSGGQSLSIRYGDGAGGFGPLIDLPAGGPPTGVAVGYADVDASPDLVSTRASDLDYSVFLSKRRTTNALSTGSGPVVLGSPVTLTAAVSTVDYSSGYLGTVSFFDGFTRLGTVPVNSNGTAALNTTFTHLGVHVMTAAFSGDTMRLASMSNALRVKVSTTAGTEIAPIASVLFLATPTPNPASQHAALSFSLPRNASVSLRIFDLNGRMVRELAAGRFAAGEHHVTWDLLDGSGRRVSPGLFFARLEVDGATRDRKFAIVR